MTQKNPGFSNRVSSLLGSATVSVMDKARKLQAEGRSIVDLSGGDPDFPSAPHVTEAGVEALKRGFTHYTPSRGIPELLQAIANKLGRENGATYDPRKEILVMPGAKQGLFIAAQAVLNPGDEAILFDPSWVSYAPCIQLAGGVVVPVRLDPQTTPAALQSALAQAVSDRTRLIVINTPNNPTGQVISRALLQVIADAAQQHDLWVLSDEIYEKLVYDGHDHVSIASLPGMRNRTMVINGLSKSHAMTGWRLGYIAAPEALTSEMLKIHQHSSTCAASFAQVAGVAALDGPQEYTQWMVGRYKARRDSLVTQLNSLPGISCAVPEGTFYAFPRIAPTGLSSKDFTDRLLDSEGVAVTPGIAFGRAGEGHVRLSFANSDEMLQEGAMRIARFVSRLG